MADYKIDWSELNNIYDFENLVRTLIFFENLLKVDLIKVCGRADLFTRIWGTKEEGNITNLPLFISPKLTEDEQKQILKNKFKENVSKILINFPDLKVYLYLNTNLALDEWRDDPRIEIINQSVITKKIEGIWKPVFRRYFKGGVLVEDPDNFSFLKELTENLVKDIEQRSITEIANIVSWVDEIAIYRPKEILEFCKTLMSLRKEPEEKEEPYWGKITKKDTDYLEKLPHLLTQVSTHYEFYGEALKSLINLSLSLAPVYGSVEQSTPKYLEQITGYYFGRDLLSEGVYNPRFNIKALDIIESLLQKGQNELTRRCLALLPVFLEMKIDYWQWLDPGNITVYREYNLPIDNKDLISVRRRALDLLISEYDKTDDWLNKLHVISNLEEALRYMAISDFYEDEFRKIIDFVDGHKQESDIRLVNEMINLLGIFDRSQNKTIKLKAEVIIKNLKEKFEIRLYNYCFGREGWSDDADQISRLATEVYEHYGTENIRDFIKLLGGFLQEPHSQPTGLMPLVREIGISQHSFSSAIFDILASNVEMTETLSKTVLEYLGNILGGIRLSDLGHYNEITNKLLDKKSIHYYTLILSSYQLKNYSEFQKSDLKIIESIIEFNKEMTLVACYALWFFDLYDPYLDVLELLEKMSKSADKKLTAQIISNITNRLHSESRVKAELEPFKDNLRPVFDNEDTINTLINIISELKDFERLDWDTITDYRIEILLKVLLLKKTDKFLEFVQSRLEAIADKGTSYQALPHIFNVLFEGISEDKQIEIYTSILSWDKKQEYSYEISHLMGAICSGNISDKPKVKQFLFEQIHTGDKRILKLIAMALDDFGLSRDFYEMAIEIILNSANDREIISQLDSSFISTMGGSRTHGQPFPSHIEHKKYISEFRDKYISQPAIVHFLDNFEKRIDSEMKQEEERDMEW